MLRYDLRHAISRNLEGRNFVLGSISAMSTNNVRSADIVIYPADHWNDGQLWVYSGTAVGQGRRIHDFSLDSASPPTYGQLNPYVAFSPQAIAADLFELHSHQGWTVEQINAAITQAHHAAEDVYLADKVDESLTLEATRHEYPIPSGFRYIHDVQVEHNPLATWGSDKLDTWRGLHTVDAQTRLSQGFKLAATNAQATGTWVGGARLYLKTVGTITPARTLTLALQTNSAGLPSGTQVTGASATLSTDSMVATPRYYHFTFSAPVLLTADTIYHLVLTTSQAAADATNYIAWGEDTTTQYTDASAAQYDGAAWSAISASTFLFSLVRSVLDRQYHSLLTDSWSITRADKLLVIDSPSEGHPIRIIGQGQATTPSADTSTIYLPERYATAKSTAICLGMQTGEEIITQADRVRIADYWTKEAELELAKMRTQVRPNSRVVEER